MKTKSLGDRMKEYERCADTHLPGRMPAFLRIDGHSFHTQVKRWKAEKPFDDVLIKAMQQTMLYLCEQIQGAVIGYTQSDEISIGFIDYQSLQTSPWFDKKVQKMCSIAASKATKAFNWNYLFNVAETNVAVDELSMEDMAEFDCRVWVLPRHEVTNYMIWRQQDWTRNSVQMAARAVCSHKECHKKNCDQLQEMIWQKGINWNDYSTVEKRGTCVVKRPVTITIPDGSTVERDKWMVDGDIPIFTQDREYVESRFEVIEQ